MSDPTKVDANDLLKLWKAEGKSFDLRQVEMRRRLILSKPLITVVAERVGAMHDDEKNEGVNQVVDLLRTIPEQERGYWVLRAAKLAKIAKSTINEYLKPPKSAKKGKGGDGEDDPIPTTGGWISGHLVELFFDRERRRFLMAIRKPNGEVSDLMDRAEIEGMKYKPIAVSDLRADIAMRNIVFLPSELGEELTEDELLDKTNEHIHKYFDFGADRFFENFTPNYVPFSYTYDAFSEVSYLRARGDYGTGKTRYIKTVGRICYRATYISGGTSPATIYNMLDDWRGTLVLNEGDFTQSDDASIIAKILNGGTERDEFIGRMAKNGAGDMYVKTYNIFGPKVIATRRDFDDRAIESRCITMDMVSFHPRKDIPLSSPPQKDIEELRLRNLWTTYRMFHAKERITVDENLRDNDIEPRLNQIVMPLLMTITSETAKGKIKDFLREHNAKTKEGRYSSKTARVVEGLVIANSWGPASEHPSDENRVYLKDVTKAANMQIDEMKRKMDEEEDEGELVTNKDGSKVRKKTKMTSRGVSFILESFCQVATRRVTDGGDDYRGTMEIIWDELRIKGLCERYAVEWRERGSHYGERPKTVVFNLNSPTAVWMGGKND